MTIDWTAHYAERTRHMKGSAIRELLKVTECPDIISFAGGLPAAEIFPLERVAAVSADILRRAGTTALQYGTTEGHTPLRQLIAERMSLEARPLSPENILITTGSQQALDLLGKVFLDEGDSVAVESPTYLAALQAWRAYRARFLSVAADADGMNPDHLESCLSDRPTLVYCLPNFQNPSGVTLSLSRRERLVDMSRRHGVPLVEDDPYRDLRFEGSHLPRLIDLDAAPEPASAIYDGTVISVGTFSKILAPGLRVGWVIAAPDVIAQLVLAKQGTDLHTPTFNQMIAFELLRSGYLEEHLKVIADTYRERRDVMLEALEQHFPDGTRWTRPQGGMFLWIELPEGMDASALLEEAIGQGVAFVPGADFHADGSGRNTMRLNFSNSRPELIREGIARLGRAAHRLLLETPRGLAPSAPVT